jgi:hypothetical protein
MDLAEDIFNGHKDWLNSIKVKAPTKLHAMMHRIYKQSQYVTIISTYSQAIG